MPPQRLGRAVRLGLALLLIATGSLTACGSASSTSPSSAADQPAVAGEIDGAESPDVESVEEDASGDEAAAGGASAAVADDEDRPDDPAADAGGPDIDLFAADALAEPPTVVPCTLSEGAETTCHQITVVGYPVDHDMGPYCPQTIDDTADDAGIWFDGDGQYDLDGAFIVGLAELYGDDRWLLHDEDGTVRVTDSPEAFAAAARPNVAPEYQNHCVEGQIEWLSDGRPVEHTVLLPTSPVPATTPVQSRHSLGVTLNGVMIAAAAPLHAILGAYTIAAFDDCGGHVNPIDGYHLHGATGCSGVEVDGHTPLIGYALDGYPIHDPEDPDEPEDGETSLELDWCGGHVTDDLGYHYHAAPAAQNMVIGCLAGQYAVSGR